MENNKQDYKQLVDTKTEQNETALNTTQSLCKDKSNLRNHSEIVSAAMNQAIIIRIICVFSRESQLTSAKISIGGNFYGK